MAYDSRPMVLLTFCEILAACSSTPAGKPATTVATTQPSAGSAQAAPSGDVDPSLVKAGYRVLKRNNQVLYCRSETITGQRIATQVCLTAAQIQTEKQNVTKARDLMSQGGNRCVKPACE